MKKQISAICCVAILLAGASAQNFAALSGSGQNAVSGRGQNAGTELLAAESGRGQNAESELRAAAESEKNALLLQLAMSTADYLATPGDVYRLAYLAGSISVNTALTLDANYVLKVHNLGTLNARGQTFLQLKEQVEKLVVKNYPLSGVQFALTAPGIFTVLVKGEVRESSLVTATGLTRLSEVLEKRVTDRASLRDIRITTADGKYFVSDLFEAKRNGDLKQDPYVRPGYVVTVEKASRRVQLAGSVYRPDGYQLLASDTGTELIEKYGDGFRLEADESQIIVSRIASASGTAGESFKLTYQELQSFPLQDGDMVMVNSRRDKMNVLTFEGALSGADENTASDATGIRIEGSRKVLYRYYPGEFLSVAVKKYALSFLPEADLEKAYVLRGTTVIPVDLSAMLYKADYSTDVVLENGDRLILPFRQYFVVVSGQVKNPGKYPYVPGRYVDYYIALAGGINDDATNGKKIRLKDLNGNPLSNQDEIPPEAVISVPASRLIYYINRYASVVTLSVSLASLGVTLYNVMGN